MPNNTPNPIMKSVSTSDTNAHKLTDLLTAAFASLVIPKNCAQIRIALDVNAPGDLYIGNDDVSATNCAQHLVASQYWDSFAREKNDIPLQDIYVKAASGSATIIGITILQN